MKKIPAIPKVIEKIEALANEVAENDDKFPLLYEEIQKLADKGKIPLERLVVYMMENTENVDALLAVKEACEDITSQIYMEVSPKEIYQASLFAIPMLYTQSADFQINQLDGNSAEFVKLTKSFKKSGLFSKHSIFYLDNHLYHPQELLNLSFDNVFSMNKAMMNKLLGVEGEDFKINLVPEVRPENGNDTFTLKYMIGVKLTNESLLEQDSKGYTDENLEKYLNISQPLLQKMLKSEDLALLAVEPFFEGLQLGLDTYLSNARQIQIEGNLVRNGIHPHGAKAIINIPEDSDEEATIELMSKLTSEQFAYFPFEIINCRDPEELMDSIAADLEYSGFKIEDIYINMKGSIVPFVTLLKPQTQAQKDLNDFNIDLNDNAFVVTSGKKPIFH